MMILFVCLVACVESDARKFDPIGNCWGPTENVRTEPGIETGCSSKSSIAIDQNGNYWKFSDGCVPIGFAIVQDDDISQAPNC